MPSNNFNFLINKAISLSQKKKSISTQVQAAFELAFSVDNSQTAGRMEYAKYLSSAAEHERALGVLAKLKELGVSSFDVHFLSGFCFHALAQWPQAQVSWEQALQLNGRSAECANNLGAVYLRFGLKEQAEQLFLQAHSLNPIFDLPLQSLVALYRQNKNYEKALQCQMALIKINETGANYAYVATLLIESRRFDRAKQLLLKVQNVFPKSAEVANALGNVYYKFADVEQAMHAFKKAVQLAPSFSAAVGNYLLSLNYSRLSNAETFKEHLHFGQLMGAPVQEFLGQSLSFNEKLRVGFVSSDFFQHPVGQLIEPVLLALVESELDIYVYYTGNDCDDLTQRLRACFNSKMRDCADVSIDDLFDQIVGDKIDVLFDLAGHSAGHRLEVFAKRAAPIQVTYLGYPNTTGVEAMDYRLVDAFTDPEGDDECWMSEKAVRMDAPFLHLSPLRTDFAVNPLPSLTTDTFVFGCFNNAMKLSDDTISLWAQLLSVLPHAHLVLKAASFADAEVRQFQLARFAALGLAVDRVSLHSRMGYLEHLALYNTIDLCLDPFPFNGAATTIEALWMGIPTVVLQGSSHVSRVGYSINRSLDLNLFIANNPEQYIERCVYWNEHRLELNEYRLMMRSSLKTHGVSDAALSAKKLKWAIDFMVSDYKSKNKREDI